MQFVQRMRGGSRSLTNYWIFTFSEYNDFSVGSRKELFCRIEKENKWRIGPKTQNRMQLRKGDKAIFFQTGELLFIGNALVASELQPPRDDDTFGHVLLSGVILWLNPLSIKQLRKRLSFQKEKCQTKYYFQMAIRRITEKDYSNILSQANANLNSSKSIS